MEQTEADQKESRAMQRAPDEMRRLTGGYMYIKTGDEEVFIGPNGQKVDWATLDPREVARIGLEMDEYERKQAELGRRVAAENQEKMRRIAENTRRADTATAEDMRKKIRDWHDPARKADPKERTVMINTSREGDGVFLGPTPQKPPIGAEQAQPRDETRVLDKGLFARLKNRFFG